MAEQLAQQLQLQKLIERSLDNFKKIGRHNLTAAKVRSRISTLKETWVFFLNGHVAVEKAVPEPSRQAIDYFKDEVFEATEERYQTTLDFMTECLEDLEPVVSPQSPFESSSVRVQSSALSLQHLPPITLPPFDGSADQWEPFRDRFTALIINNRDLTNFARMHFLTSCVTDRARESIRNIAITAENFETAWQTLISRYENKRRLLQTHLASLFNLPAVSRESADELSALRDQVHIAVSALRNLDRTPEQLWSDVIIYSVVQKLDASTRKAWTIRTNETDEAPIFEDLIKFLSSRARALEEFAGNANKKLECKSAPLKRVHVATASTIVKSSCPICKAHHMFSACPTFTRSNPAQRRELTKHHRRCFNCLAQSHTVDECRSKYLCRVCQRNHHTMLHSKSEAATSGDNSEVRSTFPIAPNPTDVPRNPGSAPSKVQSLFAHTKSNARAQVLLATALITVRSSSGRSAEARALLDQGSERTFISEHLAQILRSKRTRISLAVTAVGGVHASTVRHATDISVSPRSSAVPSLSTTALILPTLTAYTPQYAANAAHLPHLKNLPWADPNPTSATRIDLLIGADLYSEVILEGLRKGATGQPVAQSTIFGWILSGPIDASSCESFLESRRESDVTSISVNHSFAPCALETEIKKFWELEDVPRSRIASADDQRCEAHFSATHSRASDGRYIVRLPFRNGPPIDIGNSRARAKKLLISLSRRLKANPSQRAEYAEFLAEYEVLGHMSPASSPSTSKYEQHVYIPHHPVFRAGSTTTHLRVVFNASSATSNGSCLNDHLYSGPKLQTDLPAVILKWRQFRYVYTADVAKMYRQILVDSRDVNYQRILWQPNPDLSPIDYQLLTVTYGMTCAPFLALRVLRQLVVDEGNNYPRAASILKENIYVDDVLFGGDDIPDVLQAREQLVALLKRGGFDLRKWASNSPLLLTDIVASNHGLACNKDLSVDESMKILGLGWNPSLDSFQFTISLGDSAPASKRKILSVIARLYDPLGWVTPVISTAKIFMQQLWRQKLGWDDCLPPPLLCQWQRLYSTLSALDGLKLARWTASQADNHRVELHGFADASNVAYAAVVYLKIISHSGRVTITLLMGKSKVAPLTPVSIPRLELSAAVLLARLLEFVREVLHLHNVPTFCWTDSTVALAWIRQDPARWKTFVANRVADIQSRLPGVEWHHIATGDNPADCASRGLLGNDIINHPLWWHGPCWLSLPRDEWPQSDPSVSTSEPSSEEKIVTMNCTEQRDDSPLASRWSSWPKLLRITAYIFRFIFRTRNAQFSTEPGVKPSGLALTAAECDVSRLFWIKRIQSEIFPTEIEALRKQVALPPRSFILSLHPFLDREGAHKRSLHAGLQLTLTTLRRDYWILRSRSLVKKIIRNCIPCARERAVIPIQLMGDLPAVRVTAPSRSFLHCGLDYAGPILVRANAGRRGTKIKAYIALFICLATRAIHLELVQDYSTRAFMSAFTRFCARRGFPSAIYSDNGTTFVGADRELSSAYRAALRDPEFQNSTASDRVEWHFIPPSAPHFGGVWEAGVKSVKYHLRRVLGKTTLTFEEFTTLLCRVEACLNSRPIAPLSDALDEYEVLTPGHFLVGSALTVNPEPSALHLNEHRLSRWQLICQMTDRFWKIWYNDYVNTLQQRSKWRSPQPTIRRGQLVLLRNPTLPPCKWDLGRITQCHPGSDGLTRVVTVRTGNSEYKRPIAKICVLPIDLENHPSRRP